MLYSWAYLFACGIFPELFTNPWTCWSTNAPLYVGRSEKLDNSYIFLIDIVAVFRENCRCISTLTLIINTCVPGELYQSGTHSSCFERSENQCFLKKSKITYVLSQLTLLNNHFSNNKLSIFKLLFNIEIFQSVNISPINA